MAKRTGSNKPNTHMPLSVRAKIFAPFSALKGLEDALAQKEEIVVPPVELTEYGAQELDEKLCALSPGQTVSMIWRCGQPGGEIRFLQTSGKIGKVDHSLQTVLIAGRVISMREIRKIEFLPDKC